MSERYRLVYQRRRWRPHLASNLGRREQSAQKRMPHCVSFYDQQMLQSCRSHCGQDVAHAGALNVFDIGGRQAVDVHHGEPDGHLLRIQAMRLRHLAQTIAMNVVRRNHAREMLCIIGYQKGSAHRA
ncbi:MAG: hypothetical protein IPG34_10725 [Rhodocyclaceae bacterium]|nr:hypothetical protein [Rhodocyclaceae bacterium]